VLVAGVDRAKRGDEFDVDALSRLSPSNARAAHFIYGASS
jgi:hypothetical protein